MYYNIYIYIYDILHIQHYLGLAKITRPSHREAPTTGAPENNYHC